MIPTAMANAAVHLKKNRVTVTQCPRLPSGGEMKHLALIETACASWWLAAMCMKWLMIYMKAYLRQKKMRASCMAFSCSRRAGRVFL